MLLEDDPVQVGNEGSPLSSQGNVGHSEVPHSGDPTPTGYDCWVSYLESGGHWVAMEKGAGLGEVTHCLPTKPHSGYSMMSLLHHYPPM